MVEFLQEHYTYTEISRININLLRCEVAGEGVEIKHRKSAHSRRVMGAFNNSLFAVARR